MSGQTPGEQTTDGLSTLVGSVTLAAPFAPAADGAADPWDVERETNVPAMRLVRLCGQRDPSPDQASQLRQEALSFSADDWAYLPLVARDAGMKPLVYTHLARAGLLSIVPPDVAARLAEAYKLTLVTNRRMQKRQRATLEALSAAGIEAIPLKGVDLAARVYGEIALRPIRDLDLFVRRQNLRRACRTLRGMGYHPHPGLGSPLDFTALELASLSYLKDDQPAIELHWELPHRPVYRRGLAPAVVWPRARVVEVAGHALRCLGTADELRYLCVHVTADHEPNRLIWLVDIAELVRGLPADWNWPAFIQQTIAGGLATPVAVALAHCRAELDLNLPPDVLEALIAAAQSPAERRAWATAHAYEQSPHGDLFSADGLWAHLRALESVLERMVFLLHATLPRRWVLRELYGQERVRWRALALTYCAHWWRMMEYLAAGAR